VSFFETTVDTGAGFM